MRKFSFQSKILIVAIFIFLIVSLIFLALININWTLVVGWVVGSFASIFIHLLTVFFIDYLFKKQRSREAVKFLSYAKLFITLFFHAVIFIGVIAIDKNFHSVNFWTRGVQYMYKPINIFTYIGGISLIVISIFTTQFIQNMKGKICHKKTTQMK